MGKKTKAEKSKLNFNIDIQMNLASDLARRNPKLRPYWKKNPNLFIHRGVAQHDDSSDNEFIGNVQKCGHEINIGKKHGLLHSLYWQYINTIGGRP